MIRRLLVALASTGALTIAQACGPDFFPDVFVRTARPDLPGRYVTGHLGILQTGFPSADLFVAFRYLNGGNLTAAEQKGWSPIYPLSEQYYGDPSLQPHSVEPTPGPAFVAWTVARAGYLASPSQAVNPNFAEKITTPQGFTYSESFPNCATDAFLTATATLQARAADWGRSSAFLANWLQGQDRVFAACSASVPAPQPAPTDSPLLLKHDRAYQIAAAHFYARNFEVAEQEFLSIAADKSSPWSTTAGYVAARVLIRKSFLAVNDAHAPADFEPGAMQAAGRQLRAFLTSDPPQPWRRAAEAQLALVRIRLEPEERLHELATLIAGPGEDRNYAQDVKDLLWVMSYRVPDDLRASADMWGTIKAADGSTKIQRLSLAQAEEQADSKRKQAFLATEQLRSSTPMLDWATTLRALSPERASHALTQWKKTGALPWLVAAIMLQPNSPSADPALLQAASVVSPNSPAWETVSYHRARLQIAAGDYAAAQDTINLLQASIDAQPKGEKEPSTRNALRGLSMQMSTASSGFAAHLSRQTLLAASQTSASSTDCLEVMKHPNNWHRCIPPGTQEMDTDGARILNEAAPLYTWVEVARSSTVPQPLRGAIAMQGWTRATLLGDSASAAALQALMPNPVQSELASSSPLMPWMVLTRNPGLQPFMDRGVQRAYSYDFVENYRLNWCYEQAKYTSPLQVPAFLTPQQIRLGKEESSKVSTIRSVDVGRKILLAVRANPSDKLAPEALYLVLRMIRYGCNPVKEPGYPLDFSMSDLGPDPRTGEQLLQLRRDTASLMRRYYAASSWTTKAAPFVGEVHSPK